LPPESDVQSIGYLPAGRVVGLSKFVRVVDCVTKRLQTQERMTSEIASTIEQALQPQGVAVMIEANHACMSTRGVNKQGVLTTTSKMLGAFKRDPLLRSEFLASIRK
jgi:GTP cyclohydrolase I